MTLEASLHLGDADAKRIVWTQIELDLGDAAREVATLAEDPLNSPVVDAGSQVARPRGAVIDHPRGGDVLEDLGDRAQHVNNISATAVFGSWAAEGDFVHQGRVEAGALQNRQNRR